MNQRIVIIAGPNGAGKTTHEDPGFPTQ